MEASLLLQQRSQWSTVAYLEHHETVLLSCRGFGSIQGFRQESGKPACKRRCAWEKSSILNHRKNLEKSDGLLLTQKDWWTGAPALVRVVTSVTFTGHDRLFLLLQTLTNNPRESVSFLINSKYLHARCWGHSSGQTDPILVLVENIVAWRIQTKQQIHKNK